MNKKFIFILILTSFAVFFGYLLISEKIAFLYGFFIGTVNLGFSLILFFWQRGKAPRYSGHSLTLVIKMLIIRLAIISGLLVYGFKWIGFKPESLLLGFVLGQLLFLFNQFFMVATNNVK